MPVFRASKDRLTLLLGANAASDFKLKPVLSYHSENPRILPNFTVSTLLVLYKCSKKACMIAHLFTPWFTEYFKPIAVQNKKKISSRILLLIDSAPGHTRAVIRMYNQINVVFMLLTQHPFCSPWIRE